MVGEQPIVVVAGLAVDGRIDQGLVVIVAAGVVCMVLRTTETGIATGTETVTLIVTGTGGTGGRDPDHAIAITTAAMVMESGIDITGDGTAGTTETETETETETGGDMAGTPVRTGRETSTSSSRHSSNLPEASVREVGRGESGTCHLQLLIKM